MVRYRRWRVPGATYFFTVTLRDRRSRLLVEHIGLLRSSFSEAAKRRPFRMDAAVVLPDHLHAVLTLPAGDSDFPSRWRLIKSRFSRRLGTFGAAVAPNPRGEYGLWQRRYWEHRIRDGDDLRRHIDYIHFNPVKHGLVSRVADWPHSSFLRYVKAGVLAPDWAGDAQEPEGWSYGE